MYRRPYVESSVFIAYIKGEMRGDDHDCKAIFDSILEAAIAGDFPICTSSLTIAEVFKNKRNGVELTDQENQDLRPYFREDYIRLIEIDREIAERANELCRTHSAGPDVPALRPNDAIHVACAERAGCEVLLAYDPDLTKQSHDSMRIEWPQRVDLVMVPGTLALTDGQEAVQEALALGAPSEEVVATESAGEVTVPEPKNGEDNLGSPTSEDIATPDLTVDLLDELEPEIKEKGPDGFKASSPSHTVVANEG